MEVEKLLNGNKLEPIQRAVYLFFKGLMMHKQGEDKDELLRFSKNPKNFIMQFMNIKLMIKMKKIFF